MIIKTKSNDIDEKTQWWLLSPPAETSHKASTENWFSGQDLTLDGGKVFHQISGEKSGKALNEAKSVTF